MIYSCAISLVLILVVSSSVQMNASDSADSVSPTASALVEQLFGEDQQSVTTAKDSLLKRSRKSEELRSEVVRRLIDVLDGPRTESRRYSAAW